MHNLVYLIKFLSKIPRKCEVKMIEFYQKYISPGLGNHCKFYPTCSEYTKQAIEKYGCIKGIIKGIFRILKCNPFSKGGYDPLNWLEVKIWEQ